MVAALKTCGLNYVTVLLSVFPCEMQTNLFYFALFPEKQILILELLQVRSKKMSTSVLMD